MRQSPRHALRLLAILAPLPLLAGTGGPDPQGVVYTDSDETDGPPHAALDMTGATDPGLTDDGTTTVALPFSFDWYNTSYDQVTISNNGALFFDGATSSSTGVCPGGSGTWNGVAAFWDDWAADAVTYATFGRYPDRVFAVQWEGAHDTAGGSGTVQAWILEGRAEVVIVLDDVTFGSASVDGGASAVIGVQGGSGSGLEWSCSGGLADGTSAWFGPELGRPSAVRMGTNSLDVSYTGTAVNEYMGRTLAGGDLDGDGYDDAVIGNQDEDVVYVLPGGVARMPGDVEDLATATLSGVSGDELGTGLAVGDLDGDGLMDLALGAPSDDTAGTNVGILYAVGGGLSGDLTMPADADVAVSGPTGIIAGYAGTAFSRPELGTVLASGDFDGDGYTDVAVSAPGEDSEGVNAGAVYLQFGGPSIISGGLSGSFDSYDVVFTGEAGSDQFGRALHFGDVDGDGDDDLFVGAPFYDTTGSGALSNAGRVYLFDGDSSWSGAYDAATYNSLTVSGSATSDELGWGIVSGDVDSDGDLDVAIGAPFNDDGASDAGAVYGFVSVVSLSGDLDAATDADVVLLGDANSANAGQVLQAGDVTGDGADDLLIAMPNDNSAYSGGGSIVVFSSFTGPSMSATDADHRLYGVEPGGAMGTAFVVVADHSGDGEVDILTAAPFATVGGLTSAGEVYLWSLLPDFEDADADGFVDATVGGLDCDDDDASAYPGATESTSNVVDDDCDGWVDDVVIVRYASDRWTWDLDEELSVSGGDRFDFESTTVGTDVSTLYATSGVTLWSSGSVVAQSTVWGAAPVDTLGARVSAGSSNDLTITFSSEVDAVAFRLLDPEGAFDVDIVADGSTLLSGALLDVEAGDRPGGQFVGLLFAEPIDSLTLTGGAGDAFGIDELEVVFATATDRDGDGWSEDDGDCDDTNADVNPDATEDLSNGIDDDCDGTVDGGSATLYTDYTTWAGDAALAVEEVIGFETLTAGDTVSTQYDSVGATFDGTLTVVTAVDGSAPVDTQAAQAGASATTITFEEAQQAIAFNVLDASANVTLTVASGATTLYTLTPTSGGEDTAGGVFVGYVFDYPIDSVTITNPSGTDDWGIDVVGFLELGLDDADGDGYSESDGDCDDGDASVSPDATETWYDGVDSDCDGASDYDVDGDGYDASAYGGLDCDDTESSTSPDATDVWYDGVDSDCDGASDYDVDGDGYDASAYGGTDCDDTEDEVSPGAAETWYDGVDDDCDSTNDNDADGDGYAASGYSGGLFGGGDCDDGDSGVSPGETETWYDGVDTDCSGGSDYDNDGDGYDSTVYGGTDCNDFNDGAYPGAVGEICYDGVDTDCDGASDYDCDGDGYDSETYGGTDCDDTESATYPGAADTAGDGIDSDCDGAPEFDDDGDGYDGVEDGGTDCDDADISISPAAAEIWYDGVDQDCDGASDYDADSDGYDSDGYGGTDCDDTDGGINPGAREYAYDGIDQDCDGTDDYDSDGDGYQSVWYGGTDCDDTDASINPAATEVWYDGVDGDCNGSSDYDADQDGYDSDLYGGDDCDDADATIHPYAAETPGDSIDQNCDGVDDSDEDGDGFYLSEDCDDGDASVYPGAPETCYDGVDSDCSGGSDYDCDGDGRDSTAYSGTDCDDTTAAIGPDVLEVWYDGVDADCAGDDDFDADHDGYASDVWGGTDCDDADADANPGNTVDDCAGGDEDCDGTVDEDCDLGGTGGSDGGSGSTDDGGGAGGDDAGTGGTGSSDDGGGTGGTGSSDDGGGTGGDDAGTGGDDAGTGGDDAGTGGDDAGTGGTDYEDPNAGWEVPSDDATTDGVPTSKCGCAAEGGRTTGGLAAVGLMLLGQVRRRRED